MTGEALIWPEDEAFRTLAYAVRDGVTWAINSGYEICRIAESRRDCCPLGAFVSMRSPGGRRFPSAFEFRRWLGDRGVVPDFSMVWAFAVAFDRGIESTSDVDAIRASARLGLWYRQRFLKKGVARHREASGPLEIDVCPGHR